MISEKKYFSYFCLFFMVSFLLCPGICKGEEIETFTPHFEILSNGKIDWDNGMIYGVGKGFLHENQGSKTKAFRVAQYAALESILKIAAGVRLDDKLKLKELGKGLVEIQIKALITYKEYKTEFINNVEKPYYEIVRRAPIKGVAGLTSKLLKQLKSTPLDWNIFPKEQIKTELSDEKEPWLVLDARKLPQLGSIKPALFPRIISDSGKTIYQLNSVNETALTERGMASYVETSNAVEQSKYLKEPSDTILTQIRAFFTVQDAIADQKGKRRKRRKFIIKEVKQATGLMKTNLLISEKDARDLKAEDASSKILENCRVIVVTNSPIGGIEGDNKYLLAFGIDL